MGETQSVTHMEAKFLFSFKPIKSSKLKALNIQQLSRHRIDIFIPEERKKKEEMDDKTLGSLKPSKKISVKS